VEVLVQIAGPCCSNHRVLTYLDDRSQAFTLNQHSLIVVHMEANTTQRAIGYTRVSTAEQGRSGLGLDAQRKAIEDFAKVEGIIITGWHEDVQTGKGSDALAQRPGLRAALRSAKSVKGPVVVAKLDRLARNSHFITGMMEQRVQFIVTALPKADAFTLQNHV
jgi:DNA invertase Pin-like site-specific DNA recombinase